MEPLFFIVFFVAIVEMILSVTWSAFYFRTGVPIFVYEKARTSYDIPTDIAEIVENSIPRTAIMPIRVRKLASNEYAVRESFWGGFFRIAYTPVMHGYLQVSPSEVRIKGLINWFPVVLCISLVEMPFSLNPELTDIWIFPAFLALILLAIYLIQAYRFRRVVDIAATIRSGT